MLTSFCILWTFGRVDGASLETVLCGMVVLGVIGAEAVAGHSEEPPSISIRVGKVRRAGNTYIAPFEAVNASGGTAAALQVEGKQMDGGADIETSLATIDYVAAHGRAEGGLIFSQDPAGREIVVRPVGYQTP